MGNMPGVLGRTTALVGFASLPVSTQFIATSTSMKPVLLRSKMVKIARTCGGGGGGVSWG